MLRTFIPTCGVCLRRVAGTCNSDGELLRLGSHDVDVASEYVDQQQFSSLFVGCREDAEDEVEREGNTRLFKITTAALQETTKNHAPSLSSILA